MSRVEGAVTGAGDETGGPDCCRTARNSCCFLVDPTGIEPVNYGMPFRRGPWRGRPLQPISSTFPLSSL
jgi:hypothetical protein